MPPRALSGRSRKRTAAEMESMVECVWFQLDSMMLNDLVLMLVVFRWYIYPPCGKQFVRKGTRPKLRFFWAERQVSEFNLMLFKEKIYRSL